MGSFMIGNFTRFTTAHTAAKKGTDGVEKDDKVTKFSAAWEMTSRTARLREGKGRRRGQKGKETILRVNLEVQQPTMFSRKQSKPG